jgi:hypothetical protein
MYSIASSRKRAPLTSLALSSIFRAEGVVILHDGIVYGAISSRIGAGDSSCAVDSSLQSRGYGRFMQYFKMIGGIQRCSGLCRAQCR